MQRERLKAQYVHHLILPVARFQWPEQYRYFPFKMEKMGLETFRNVSEVK